MKLVCRKNAYLQNFSLKKVIPSQFPHHYPKSQLYTVHGCLMKHYWNFYRSAGYEVLNIKEELLYYWFIHVVIWLNISKISYLQLTGKYVLQIYVAKANFLYDEKYQNKHLMLIYRCNLTVNPNIGIEVIPLSSIKQDLLTISSTL